VVTTQRYGLRRFIDQEVARWGHRLSIQLELDSLEQTMEMVVAGEARTFMLVSMCAANWRCGPGFGRAHRRPEPLAAAVHTRVEALS
jgi:hypothetical protein